ncbi:MAG: RND family transporter [Candidatus Marinimicrobia bacterium]|nr:RND family transporter [Candidatus Neomarinimicrobiota bacterium]
MSFGKQDHVKTWIDFVMQYPRIVIGFSILFTLLMGWNIPKITIDSDIISMLPEDQEIIVSINEMEEIFGGSELVIMSLKSDDIFSEATLRKIRALSEEIEGLPIVDRVLSITNMFKISGIEGGFEVRDLIEKIPENEAERAVLRQVVMDDELIYGNIVSKDFQRTSVIAILSVSGGSDTDQIAYKIFHDLKRKYTGPEEINVAGLPITRKSITLTMQKDMKALFPFGISLMIFLLIISFRSWTGAFLPFVVVIMSIINTLGLMALLGLKFSFISILIPVMLIAIANDYSIHIISHYFEEYHASADKQKNMIIHRTVEYLQTPVFLAGITTVIGFLSLQSHVLPPARQLGLLASFGVALALLLSVTFVPAALQLLDVPMILKSDDKSQRMSRFLNRWGSFFIKHRIRFLSVCLIFVLLIASGIPRIVVDTNPMHYYRKSSEIRVNNDIIDKYFGGSTQLSIKAEGDIKDPIVLRKMEQLCDYLEQEPTVTRTISIVDYIKKMNKAFNGDSSQYYVLPDTREAVAQYLLLFSISGDEDDLSQVVDYDYRQAQILARVNETSSVSLNRLLKDTRQYVKTEFGEATFPAVTGFVAVIGELVDLVVRGQMYSLILSIVLVSLVCMVLFRSVVAGLLSIVPLSVAIITVFGLMGYSGIELNVATAMLSSIMIGVGVDYTIHFLYRFRYEVQAGRPAQEAVIRTLITSGKGIIYNALSVIVGFTVLLVSGFLPIYFFGFLIVFSISTCLIGALTIMPALLVMIKPKFIFKKS